MCSSYQLLQHPYEHILATYKFQLSGMFDLNVLATLLNVRMVQDTEFTVVLEVSQKAFPLMSPIAHLPDIPDAILKLIPDMHVRTLCPTRTEYKYRHPGLSITQIALSIASSLHESIAMGIIAKANPSSRLCDCEKSTDPLVRIWRV
jgi:hypothetical protein